MLGYVTGYRAPALGYEYEETQVELIPHYRTVSTHQVGIQTERLIAKYA